MIYRDLDEKYDKKREKQMLINDMKNEYLEEYKNNLPNILNERICQLAEKLHTTERGRTLSELEINHLLRKGNNVTKTVKYSADELKIVFDYYQEAMIEINKKQVYPPSKKNFCAFAGMSSASYESYIRSADEDKREIMQMIDDFITDNALTLAQNGKIKEITTLFRGKTEHGMVEATAPVVIEHKTNVDLNTINARIQAIKMADKQKNIELKPNKDGVYEEMNQ